MSKRGYHHGNLRQALVEAALSLIEEKGPQGFTLSEAAKAADVTPAAVYRHFTGREELIAEVARQGYEIFTALMEFAYDNGKPSALAAFEATGRAYLAFARKYPGHYMAMLERGQNLAAHPQVADVALRAKAVQDMADIHWRRIQAELAGLHLVELTGQIDHIHDLQRGLLDQADHPRVVRPPERDPDVGRPQQPGREAHGGDVAGFYFQGHLVRPSDSSAR
jgi:AcrR family transcriptional regulator